MWVAVSSGHHNSISYQPTNTDHKMFAFIAEQTIVSFHFSSLVAFTTISICCGIPCQPGHCASGPLLWQFVMNLFYTFLIKVLSFLLQRFLSDSCRFRIFFLDNAGAPFSRKFTN